MKKILTFSRVFPAYHPRKGEPTYFVEAILTQLGIDYKSPRYLLWLISNNAGVNKSFLIAFQASLIHDINTKSHTIRAHKRPLKVGDYINPVCWAGKPYNKTDEGYWQIKFAPDIEVKKVWVFEIEAADKYLVDFSIQMNNNTLIRSVYYLLITNHINHIPIHRNDGLHLQDFVNWFTLSPDFKKSKQYKGNIICWNENIEY